MRFLILFLFGLSLLAVSTESYGQTSRESETKPIPPSQQTFSKKKKASKKSYKKNFDQGIKDYEDLMKANKKKYKKMEKGMEKPQYSDPTYFGHKKPPKKRSKDKRKFCKECGIIH